ncbi:MAG: DNA replication/repair protein RecF [Bacteroidia bacterium]
MHLKRLSLVHFRNCESAELDLAERINCFAGLNGSGKTNLLDAVHYLALCKSFLNAVDSQNIRHEQPFFVLQGSFISSEGSEDQVHCGVKRNQKKVFKFNQKDYDRLSEHIGRYPVVVISPADSVIITGGSDERRRFMDSVISQYDRIYLERLIAYNQILAQRNSLLKQFADSGRYDADTLEVYNMQLAEQGMPVFKARKLFSEALLPLFNMYYTKLCGGAETVSLKYVSQLHDASFPEILDRSFSRDRAVLHTTAGIHKDDLEFEIGSYPLKRSGSQGQQKTFLIALKLAQYVFLQETSQKRPMLLLDDIHDKLDAKRVECLMDLVCGEGFGQVFITDTDGQRMQDLFAARELDFRLFHVSEGMVSV